MKVALFLGVFLSSLAGVMAFNRVVDPYDVFGGGGHAARALRGRANLVMDGMVDASKISKETKQQAAVVIIGDSRARALTTERVAGDSGAPILNLGVGGASFEEAVTMFEDQAAQLKSVRLVIACLPMERFSAAARPNRCDEVRSLVANPLRYLANAEILQHSWTLRQAPPVQENRATAVATPVDDEQSVLVTWRRMFADFNGDRMEQRVRRVEQTFAPLVARGVKIVFWWPPVKTAVAQQVTELDLAVPRSALQVRLQKMGTVVDMTEWTSLHETEFQFSDPVHTRQGAEILRELLVALPPVGNGARARQSL